MLGERAPAHLHSARALSYSRVSNGVEMSLLWGLLVGVVSVAAWGFDVMPGVATMLGVAVGGWALVLGWFVLLLPPLSLRFRRYELTDDAAYIQHGFITRRRTVVPYARIQFVMTQRGPIARRFGLATVVVQTSAGAVGIPMLDDEVAETLWDRLSELARRSVDDL